jgi:hypothetical protein
VGIPVKLRNAETENIPSETRLLSPRTKIPFSFVEGFYIDSNFFSSVADWLDMEVKHIDEKLVDVVYWMNSDAESVVFWNLLHQTFVTGKRKDVQLKDLREWGHHSLKFAVKTHKPKNVDFTVTVMLDVPERQKESTPAANTESQKSLFLSRHNTPGLMQRRTAKIAEANVKHSKDSDDTLTEVLEKFQKLTF